MVASRAQRPGTAGVALCVLGSGLCALIYQTTWLREFRLIFGSSTAASAAVLAIFMGGLGAGSIVLGRKVDRLENPFRFYARLELFIALAAAITPLLVWLVRQAYIALGGTLVLGLVGGTGLRLLLATLVLIVPTFLMGGTLPAAVRAVQADNDPRRRQAALLYGINTLGAVTGALLATFFLFEHLGNRLTLWAACALNVGVALVALRIAGRREALASSPDDTTVNPPRDTPFPVAPVAFTFAAAAGVGFAFFLMELVWYRMLAPLLGGSTFTFGLILAVALAGIALGSLGYFQFRAGKPVTLHGFAAVCALEALLLALPFALGDRVAILTIALQGLGAIGFACRVVQWTAVTALVVLPAALVAGAQFPMLIALLGRDRTDVGRHTGLVYAWNTAGAITGSLAGGFGLLPLLTAPGAWQLVVVLLVTLAGAALLVSWWCGHDRSHQPSSRLSLRPALPALVTGAAALLCLTAPGPTAAWRHSPIGAGRVKMVDGTANEFQAFLNARRRMLRWEAEGRESSVALMRDEYGLAFLINGKVDGNARFNASTQVMLGLLPALVHPAPHRALVIGLGTGSTAGWLADVPGMARVDVVELEPAILQVAGLCAPVNRCALTNPRVHVWLGDAREHVLAGHETFDVIASEPSNPYRAGVASLFTQEFYAAAACRLRPGGIFAQWVQAYEVDGETVSSIYATLASVFPVVETWKTEYDDLLFIASQTPIVYDVANLRTRIGQEPFRSALANVWRVTDLEGVFGHYVAHRNLARAVSTGGAPLATDDRNGLEFAFARTVGRKMLFSVENLLAIAYDLGCDRPETQHGELDLQKVLDRRVSAYVLDGRTDFTIDVDDKSFRARTAAKTAYARGELAEAARLWQTQPQPPEDLLELVLMAEGLAARGDDRAPEHIARLRARQPAEADAVEAQWLWCKGRYDEAAQRLERVLRTWRAYPWTFPPLMKRTLDLALLTMTRPEGGYAWQARLFQALEPPFVLDLLDLDRVLARLETARRMDENQAPQLTRGVLASLEPNPPWRRDLLTLRAETYRSMNHPLARRAASDLARFNAGETLPFRFSPRAVPPVERPNR